MTAPSAPVNHFGDRLAETVRARSNPVVVGLDPHLGSLPAGLLPHGCRDPRIQADAVAAFCQGVIDAVAGLVPAVKPQSAFFEQIGPEGMSALRQVIQAAADAGLLIILDAKRGDIGSTASAYASGLLGPGATSAWGADALTVNPYLGGDSLDPFMETARDRGGGVFILVKTSNTGGGLFQDLVADGLPVYRHVARWVEAQAEATLGTCGFGIIGAVTGATWPGQLAELRGAMPHAWLLVPGYGAQGGGAREVAAAFHSNGLGAIVNSSRGIIFAHARPDYRDRYPPDRWQDAVREAAVEMIEDLRSHTAAGRLVS
jgi:orotidine-5'-phosphate decarboxylase